MRNVNLKTSIFILVVSLLSSGLVFAQTAPTSSAASAEATSVSQIIDRIVGREAVLAAKMRGMHPLVETYLQSLDKDDELAFRPTGDNYFLGKLDFNAEDREHTMLPKAGFFGNIKNSITGRLT